MSLLLEGFLYNGRLFFIREANSSTSGAITFLQEQFLKYRSDFLARGTISLVNDGFRYYRYDFWSSGEISLLQERFDYCRRDFFTTGGFLYFRSDFFIAGAISLFPQWLQSAGGSGRVSWVGPCKTIGFRFGKNCSLGCSRWHGFFLI